LNALINLVSPLKASIPMPFVKPKWRISVAGCGFEDSDFLLLRVSIRCEDWERVSGGSTVLA
jgi:hypothetical protein